MDEFKSEVFIEDIAIRDTEVSRAVDEPIRSMILDMLSEKEMTVSEIHSELSNRGYEKRVNTIRHHINELRDAELIEISYLKEVRGGTEKHYKANTLVLSYTVPEKADEKIDEIKKEIQPQIKEILKILNTKFDDDIEDITDKMAPCEHCKNQKYKLYLMSTIIRKAFVQAYQS